MARTVIHAALLPDYVLTVGTFTLCGLLSDDSMIGVRPETLPLFDLTTPGACGSCIRSTRSRSTAKHLREGALIRRVGLRP